MDILRVGQLPPAEVFALLLVGIGPVRVTLAYLPLARPLLPAVQWALAWRTVLAGFAVALASAVFAVSGGAAAGATLAATESGVGLPAAQVAALKDAFLAGYQAALLTCAVAVGIGAVVSLCRGRGA